MSRRKSQIEIATDIVRKLTEVADISEFMAIRNILNVNQDIAIGFIIGLGHKYNLLSEVMIYESSVEK